jgi:hypothetical protein
MRSGLRQKKRKKTSKGGLVLDSKGSMPKLKLAKEKKKNYLTPLRKPTFKKMYF